MLSEKQIKTFWNFTEAQENGCIHHLAKSKSHGYPTVHFRVKSSDKKNGVFMAAHRMAWAITFGPIPSGLFVCHKCDNPQCCNPEHLFLGTHQDNMRDMAQKGRANYKKGQLLAVKSAMSESSRQKRKTTFESIGHQQGSKNSQHGSFWISNGVESKKWKSSIGEIPNGFSKGRVMTK